MNNAAWTIEDKNNVCEQICAIIGIEGFTCQKKESSYIKLYATSGKLVQIRVSNHSENESRRFMCDHYLSVVNDPDPIKTVNDFFEKHDLKFDYTFKCY